MISVLISGRLAEPATKRAGKSGKEFVSAKVIADMRGSQYGQWVNVVAFSESACAALLALQPDEALSVAGDLRVGTYTGRDGQARPSLDVIGNAVLTMRMARQPRRPKASGEQGDGEYGGQPGQVDERSPPDDSDDIPY